MGGGGGEGEPPHNTGSSQSRGCHRHTSPRETRVKENPSWRALSANPDAAPSCSSPSVVRSNTQPSGTRALPRPRMMRRGGEGWGAKMIYKTTILPFLPDPLQEGRRARVLGRFRFQTHAACGYMSVLWVNKDVSCQLPGLTSPDSLAERSRNIP